MTNINTDRRKKVNSTLERSDKQLGTIQRAIYFFLEFLESKVTFDFAVKNREKSRFF